MRQRRCCWCASPKGAADLLGHRSNRAQQKSPEWPLAASGILYWVGVFSQGLFRSLVGCHCRLAGGKTSDQPWRLLVWMYSTSRNTVGTSTNIRLATKPRSLVSIAKAFSAKTVSLPQGANQGSSSLVVVCPERWSSLAGSAASSSPSLSCTGQAVGPTGSGWALAWLTF